MVYTRTAGYQINCFIAPVFPSALFSAILTGVEVIQGSSFTPRKFGNYFGVLYAYHAIQCPMEAIHGRKSLLHNVISGGVLGYVGVSTGRAGIPFVHPSFLHYNKGLSAPQLAFLVYGGMAGALAMLGGKQM